MEPMHRKNKNHWKTRPSFIIFCIILLINFIPGISLAQQENIIKLKSKIFSPPKKIFPAVASELSEKSKERIHVLIHFSELPGNTTKNDLQEKGIKLLSYIPNNAWYASIPKRLRIANNMPDSVNWVGKIEKEYKIDLRIKNKQFATWAKNKDSTVNLIVHFFKDVELQYGISIIENLNGRIVSRIRSINALVVALDGNSIEKLSDEDEVQWIEHVSPRFGNFNDGARICANQTPLETTPYDLHGSNVQVLVYDGGSVDNQHEDFGNRVSLGETSTSIADHATHVAGIIGGNGDRSLSQGGTTNQWRGMADQVEIVSFSYSAGAGDLLYNNPGDIEIDYTDAIDNFGADISNNSIGSNIALNGYDCDWEGDYEASAILIDGIVRGSLGRNFPIVWSAGNERGNGRCGTRNSTISVPAAAKNSIVVGAINSNDNSMTNFSSWGPVDDGRLKPDVVAPGCQADGDFGINSTIPTNVYGTMCGTSMAAPVVTGISSLIIERFRALYASDPLPSTIKALLINTAEDLAPEGPDYMTGFGKVDATKAIDTLNSSTFIEDSILSTFETVLHSIDVPPNTPYLKATLVWDDEPGTAGASPALVNQLDLTLIAPDGTNYHPWVLNPDSPDQVAQRGRDEINNVEQVSVNNPAAGTWKILVIGQPVPLSTQDFSVVWNVGPPSYTHYISGTITQNTTMQAYRGPYVVNGNLTVTNGATLTIEPGTNVTIQAPVTIQANSTLNIGSGALVYMTGGSSRLTVDESATLVIGAGVIFKLERPGGSYTSYPNLQINGKIQANGTSSSPIIFTSYRDDSVGGNTNGGSAFETGVAGDWTSIYLNGAKPESYLSYCQFRYGGQYYYYNSATAQLQIANSAVAVTNCTVSNGYGDGVALSQSPDATVSGCTISDNAGFGISISGDAPTVTGNTLSGNNYAFNVELSMSEAVFANNTVNGGTHGQDLYVSGGTITTKVNWPNLGGSRVVKVVGGLALTEGGQLTIGSGVVVYMTGGSSRLTVDESATLVIGAGVIFKLERPGGSYTSYPNLQINGKIQANGTSSSPIIFTSYRDDSVGGNTNGGSAFETGVAGDWTSIYLNGAKPESYLSYCQFRYGGQYYYYNSATAQLQIANSAVAVTNCTISYGYQDGVALYNSNVSIEHCSIYNNNRHGIYLELSTVLVHYCGIWSNTGNGIYNFTPTIIAAAENNWWGHASGPGGAGPGTGDEVSTGVDYSPWLDSYSIPPCTHFLSPSSQSHSNKSENGSFIVESETGCSWTAESNDSWIGITAGQSGVGDGAVSYCIQENQLPSKRVGSITVGSSTFSIIQSAKSNPLLPVITSISPSIGVIGAEITITGNNFGSINEDGVATFTDGVIATEIVSWSNSQIVCVIPDQAQSGCVTVTTNEGLSNCFLFNLGLDHVSPINGTISSNTTLGAAGSPYVITGDLVVSPGVTLTISPGVKVQMAGNFDFSVEGTLNATGAIFTSGPYPPKVSINSGGWANLTDCTFRGGSITYKAGSGGNVKTSRFLNATINLYSGQVIVSGCYISKPGGNGIYISDCSPNIYNCEITGCLNGIYIEGASSPTILYNSFRDNTYAVYNAGTGTAMCNYNWWGDDSGPTVDSNPGGTGDAIYGNVNYAKWSGQDSPRKSVFGTNNYSPKSGNTVNTATGNFTYAAEDLFISGFGLNVSFTRYYNSQSRLNGPLGYGWSHSYQMTLSINAKGAATIHYSDGQEQTFLPDGSGGFLTPPDVFDKLTNIGGGAYELLTKNQFWYILKMDGAIGRLHTIADLNGNSITFDYDANGDLQRITDTAGRVIAVACDASHRITSLTDPIGRLIEYSYNADGDLEEATDARDNFELYTYAYDAKYHATHQMSKVVDKRGKTKIELKYNTYDPAKVPRVTSQKDANGGLTSYTYRPTDSPPFTILKDPDNQIYYHYYDANFRLTKEVDPKENFAEYTYDAKGNRTSVKDKLERVTTFDYDERGNVIKKTNPLGKRVLTVYNSLNLPTYKIDELGYATELKYDDKGNLLSVTDALSNTVSYTYNFRGQKITETDARGKTTNFAYDGDGNLEQVTNARGGKTRHTYDAVSRLLTTTDPLDRVTTYTYDPNDNRTSIKNDLSQITKFTYDPNDNLLTTTNPLNETVRNQYDLKNRLVKVTDPLNNQTVYTYDKLDRKTRETDPLNNQINFTYDELGNLLTVKDALNNTTKYTYDENGRKLSMTDARGDAYVTTYEYDELGRLIKVTDAAKSVTQAVYDHRGSLIQVTDPLNRVTGYDYDALGRVIKETDPLLKSTLFNYDANGNLSTKRDGNNIVSAYTYDELNRLTRIDYTGGDVTQFTYDEVGNRRSMTDAVGTTNYIYDALNRPTKVTDAYGKTVGYQYDRAGRRISLIYPGNKKVVYGYDAAGRLTSVTDWLNKRTDFNYDWAGKLKHQVNANGTTVDRQYDIAGRLIGLQNKKSGGAVISSHSFTLDPVGNRTGVNETLPLAPKLVNQSLTFDHNAGHQLTSDDIREYTYDLNGNRTSSDSGTKLVNYDYNPMDRLTEVNDGTRVDTYRYNGDGALVSAVRKDAETRYVLDTAAGMPHILAETNSSGGIQRYHIYGNGLLYSIRSSTSHYYHYDAIGSTLALTDPAETITDKYAYGPYGEPAGASGTTPNRFRYVGQFGVMKEDNGLTFMRARFYDPVTKRFMGKDLVKGSILEPVSLNLYSYTVNNPVRWTDPEGKSWFSPTESGYQNIGVKYRGRGFESGKSCGVYKRLSTVDYHVLPVETDSSLSLPAIGTTTVGVGYINDKKLSFNKYVIDYSSVSVDLGLDITFKLFGDPTTGQQIGFSIGLGYGIGSPLSVESGKMAFFPVGPGSPLICSTNPDDYSVPTGVVADPKSRIRNEKKIQQDSTIKNMSDIPLDILLITNKMETFSLFKSGKP